MIEKLRKILELILIVLIVGLSITIFLLREKIQNVNNMGYLGLLMLCFLANSTVFLPAPSLMITASCALIMNPLLVAIFAAAGATLGEFVGYAFGVASKDISHKVQRVIDKVSLKIKSQSLLVFIFAVLPLPLFDFVGIYSGGTKMNLIKFFVACFLGKFIKMLVYTKFYDIMSWALSFYT